MTTPIGAPWYLLQPETPQSRPRLVTAFLPMLDREQGPAVTRARHCEGNRYVKAKHAARAAGDTK